VIKSLLNPLFLALLILVVAQIGIRLKGQTNSKVLIAGTCLLYFSSIPLVSNFFSQKLENQIEYSSVQKISEGDVILLMGGSVEYRPRDDRIFQLGPSGDRILRVLELSKTRPNLEIWISENEPSSSYKLLTNIGVPENRIKILGKAKNTLTEISVFAAELVRRNYSKPIAVTSASHMGRVVSLLKEHKIDAIPAHAAYKTTKNYEKGIRLLIPTPQALTANTIVLHENIATLLP